MNFKYIFQLLFHILLGTSIYLVNIFPRIFFFIMTTYFLGTIIITSKSQKQAAVLKACAYIVGAEVLFRMTNGAIFYESSKYLVIVFVLIGMFYDGISNKAYPYFIFLILLVPSIVVASSTIGYDSNLRTNVAFALSGPVCLGLSALYCYDKKISKRQILDTLLYLALPIISLTTYLFLYTPSLKEVITSTQSNFAASGGFGPNQVSSILGLGMFVFCVQYFLNSKTLFLKILNIVLFGLVTFRGIITFSRGGILTAVLMIFAFLFFVYFKSSQRQKYIIVVSFLLLLMTSSIVWVVSSNQTSGLIDRRYSNQDGTGKVKEDISAGRVALFIDELEGFINSPFLGVGTNGTKEARISLTGRGVVSHNELSRILSEHGILGVMILLILVFKPLDLRLKSRNNYFFYAFLVFWFATINHSAMRIAAPGFIYALALLTLKNEKHPIYRKRLR